MAFQLNALDPSNSGSGGASLLGTYRTADAFADTLAAGYFNEAAGNLGWTHALLVKASDKTGILIVSVALGVVTVTEFGGSSDAVTQEELNARIIDPSTLEDDGTFIAGWEKTGEDEEPVAKPVQLIGDSLTSADGKVPVYGPAGVLRVANPTIDTHAVNRATLNQRVATPSAATLPTDARSYVQTMARAGAAYTPNYVLIGSYTAAPVAGQVVSYGTGGRVRIADGVDATDAASLGQVSTVMTTLTGTIDSRLTADQRGAIDGLTAESTAADIVAALQTI